METAIKSIRSLPHTFDRGDEHFRPGVVWSVDGASAVIRVFCSPGDVRDFAGATAALPNAGVGAPVVAKFHNTSFDSISALYPAVWGWGNGPRDGDELGAVSRGEFHLCVISRELTGAPELFWREG